MTEEQMKQLLAIISEVVEDTVDAHLGEIVEACEALDKARVALDLERQRHDFALNTAARLAV